ncbi:hypothetical protein NDI44_01005 [Trichocoleus sp. DQ-A3]|nr:MULTISPECIES: hypothetical protein [unclassified Coleofasciculus]MBD1889089.1 hypothetical protein [Coleofasciculus sp. FACHB-SPT9]MBD1893577.1 hypothetical protein [Coleofasciculus sp. FACHB-129]MBD1901432.1 hypothetical protein [Coleofasciculus sp. FACHB-125]MBD2087452.1 hypothetical protein [Coleofasciculus sp. FACHB-542]MBD2538612.1 hypothetical protein [Coleofasciculus sp. FACHB-SPT36]
MRLFAEMGCSLTAVGQLSGQPGVRIDCKSHQTKQPSITIDYHLLPAA